MLKLDLKSKINNLVAAQNFTGARSLCVKLCKQNPGDAEAQFLYGAICGQLGDYSQSEKALRKAFSQAPNHPQLNFNLSVALFEQKKYQQAIEYASRTVQLEPGNYHAWLYLGQICEACEQLDDAEKAYSRALQIQPESDSGYRKLGDLYIAKEQWQSAAEIFNKLMELGYLDEEVINGMCISLTRAYQFDKLISIIEPLAIERPDAIAANYYVAMSYMELGEMASAEKYFSAVLASHPIHAESVAGLAGVFKFKNDYDAAEKLISPFVSSKPDNPGVVLVFAAIAHKCNRVDEAIQLLLALLDNNDLATVNKAKALVALGSLYEEQGDYSKGFEYIQRGNKVYSPGFDRDDHMRSIESLEQLYSAQNISLLPGSGVSNNTPIFIVGMLRSGTSLVEQILASHSDVFGAGELKYIYNYSFELNAQQINGKSYPYCMEDVSQAELLRLSEDYLEKLKVLSDGSPSVTDKLPTNFMYLGLIYQLFPNAKILHCTRDPMDTCVSCYSKFFSGAHTYTYDLADLGFYYRSYERLMRLWKNNLPIKIFDVNYEELVNNQEKVVKDILAYCELPWEEECMNFYNTSRTVATASTDQVRKPMYTSSIDKWRRNELDVKPLIKALEEFK